MKNQQEEIKRLRLSLINQISRTRHFQEKLELIEEAVKYLDNDTLSEFFFIVIVRAIVSASNITIENIERVKELQKRLDKTK